MRYNQHPTSCGRALVEQRLPRNVPHNYSQELKGREVPEYPVRQMREMVGRQIAFWGDEGDTNKCSKGDALARDQPVQCSAWRTLDCIGYGVGSSLPDHHSEDDFRFNTTLSTTSCLPAVQQRKTTESQRGPTWTRSTERDGSHKEARTLLDACNGTPFLLLISPFSRE